MNRPLMSLGEPGDEAKLTHREKKALLWSVLIFALAGIVMLVFALSLGLPWRNESGSFLPRSPLMSSIVCIIFTLFCVSGYAYGRVVGSVRGMKDVPVMMGAALTDMISFLVLALYLGQFIALFNWSGIGFWTAVQGAGLLENAGVTGFSAIILFVFDALDLPTDPGAGIMVED